MKVAATAAEWFAPEAEIGRLVWTAVIVVGASLPHWSQLPIWIPLLLIGCVAWRLIAEAGG